MSHHAVSWAMRGADVRRWAFYSIGAQMGRIDTGVMHGPQQWLEPQSAVQAPRHERMRLFAPVDVMPGQTGMEL